MTLEQVLKQSCQIYLVGDFVADEVYVNKRIPLVVRGVNKSDGTKVRDRIISLYGKDKQVYISDGGEDLTSSDVADICGRDIEYIVCQSEELIKRNRFDFSDLQEILIKLRGEGGCEWDRAQTHKSIRINLIEEAYELVEGIDADSVPMILEETGDVLLQAAFHAQIASENGEFDFGDAFTILCRKLLDRHTHIFGENHADNAEQALGFWTEAKKKEKKYSSLTDAMERVPKNLPALLYAEKLQKIARRGGFDWVCAADATNKVYEEIKELEEASVSDRAEEAGDLLFAVCNVLRFYKVDPEAVLHDANRKFLRRFAALEKKAIAQGKELTDFTFAELDSLWEVIKREEKC